MKAIELLQSIKQQTREQELKCIKEILTGACTWGLKDKEVNIYIDEISVNIKNHFYDIDSIPLRDWLNKYCLVSNTDYNFITIRGLK